MRAGLRENFRFQVEQVVEQKPSEDSTESSTGTVEGALNALRSFWKNPINKALVVLGIGYSFAKLIACGASSRRVYGVPLYWYPITIRNSGVVFRYASCLVSSFVSSSLASW